MIKKLKDKIPNDDFLDLSIQLLAGLMDRVTQKMIMNSNHGLPTIVDDLKLDDASFAETLSIVWYRALFGANPDPSELGDADILGKLPHLKSPQRRSGRV